jgi:hypothetical protein
MTKDLHSLISDLAADFATAVVSAIHDASLQDILALASVPVAPRRGPGRPRDKAMAPTKVEAEAPFAKASAARSQGPLRRRSPEDVAKVLDRVVAVVKESKSGLRSEEIRQKLGLQAKEMPRILKEGLAKRALKRKGEKRSTVYSVA